jgi:hypothetical protein
MSLRITDSLIEYVRESQNNSKLNEFGYAVKKKDGMTARESIKSYYGGTYNLKSDLIDSAGDKWIIVNYDAMLDSASLDDDITFITGKPKNNNRDFIRNSRNRVDPNDEPGMDSADMPTELEALLALKNQGYPKEWFDEKGFTYPEDSSQDSSG